MVMKRVPDFARERPEIQAPMQFLDIRTLSFLTMASTLLLALAMQLSTRIARGNPAVRAWTWGAGLNVLGLALIGLRGMAPDFISM